MPKKRSTKKNRSSQTGWDEDKSNLLQEDLPQVWLADQPGEVGAQNLEEMGSQREIRHASSFALQVFELLVNFIYLFI